MKKAIIVGLSLAYLFFTGFSQASLINVAPNGAASASSTWSNSGNPKLPAYAIDGDPTTDWNAGKYVTQWLEIDFGSAISINQITGLVAQDPEGDTTHIVYLDGHESFTWTGYTTRRQLLTHEFLAPVLAQHVRIETTQSSSWIAWWEIQVLTEIPESPSIFLLGLGFSILWTTKMRKEENLSA